MKRQSGKLARNSAFLMGLVAAIALLCPCSSRAADQSLEYRVKAAFLLNFTKFIEWPPTAFAQPDSPIAICVMGEDPFGATLDLMVSGEVVNGRKVVARRIKSGPSPHSCQVMFIGGPQKDVATILADSGPGVLTVGEGEAFVHDGGVIAFIIEDRRVRFGINQAAAQRAGLKLSSKLLSVAKSVQ